MAGVVINEIHHSPDVKQERVEFVELLNDGPAEVQVGGWSLAGAVDYRIPAGAVIPARGYLVVAEDPAALKAKYGVEGALGPWLGRLSGGGERVVLVDGAGVETDHVDYGLGFPWPTVGDAPGHSIELIHPGLDNTLGGNWRASVASAAGLPDVALVRAGGAWRFWRGKSEPTGAVGAWRNAGYADAAWETGGGPVGYDPDILGPATTGGTRLSDMRGGYTTIYLRTGFDLPDADRYGAVRLEALYDDGVKVWLNGELLFRDALDVAETPYNGVASVVREDNTYAGVELPVRSGLLRTTGNVLAVQVANASLLGSSDCFFDCRLTAVGVAAPQGPTPGRLNRVAATNAPPALRQVSHRPVSPKSGDAVIVSVRATDPEGVASVILEYQVVQPGNYIRFDTAAYATNWTRLTMNDAGLGGDAVAGDSNWAAVLPPSVQAHRHLVRYRIVARDRLGAEVRVPYADDAQRNFAYFTYDGVPAWEGAVRPGDPGALGTRFRVESTEMNRLPVYHLLALRSDVEASTWTDRSHGDEYFWTGTLVYEGEVYDHIRFRPRGGVWRYAMGKNMWKFDFNRGHDFQARDNWGRRMPQDWGKLNLGACIQQGDYLHRGEQGLFESVGFKLFQLAGTPAGETAFVQFRVVDAAVESDPNQYGGDFWGLYLAVEQLDSRYLSARGMPDGNLYKMEAGFGDPNNLGPAGPTDASDLRQFLDAYQAVTRPTEAWWRTNLNLPSYYSYQAIVQAIHHYDIADGKNYFYYRDPVEGRWTVLPWDLDLTWSDNMYRGGQTGGDEPFKSRVLSNFDTVNPVYPGISREFRNRVREIRDLLWNTDEVWRLIDEYARLVRGTNRVGLLDVDRAQWDYNPVMMDGAIVNTSKAGWGRYYQSGITTRDFDGMIRKMRQYVSYRAMDPTFSLDTMSRESGRPSMPTLGYSGSPTYPVNRLTFFRSPYTGARGLATVRWRIGEITRTNHPAYDPTRPLPYEIDAVVDSGAMPAATSEWSPPPGALRVGRLYRARVQFTDTMGATSNWSQAVEFTGGEPDSAGADFAQLDVSELMFDPPADGYEFIELHNRDRGQSLDISGARFVDGISFQFGPGSVLLPDERILLVRTTNVAGFREAYGLPAAVRVLGTYDGALSNAGETVAFRAAAGSSQEIRFTYAVGGTWPAGVNGAGYSLVPSEVGPTDRSLAAHWRTSTAIGGSPGRADPSVLRITGVSITPSGLRLTFDAAWTGVRVQRSDTLRDWTDQSATVGVGEAMVTLETGVGARWYRLVR
jgi:hypothetical protein